MTRRKPKPTAMTCPGCHGQGYRWRITTGPDRRPVQTRETCPACNGKGTIA